MKTVTYICIKCNHSSNDFNGQHKTCPQCGNIMLECSKKMGEDTVGVPEFINNLFGEFKDKK